MRPTIVLLVVALTPKHLGPLTPNLTRLAGDGAWHPLTTVTPAVTCSVQATFMTGTLPCQHGAVANGWLFRDLLEIWLWRQSNRLVAGEKVWEAGKRRDPGFTTANLFWWYNMAATHDIGLTPRPQYKADGRKIPDCYAVPASLRDELKADLLLASDGPRLTADRPTIFLGCRGGIRIHLDVNLREGGHHSGNWGGVLANPATILANAIASLVDQHGRMKLDALKPPRLTNQIRAYLADVEIKPTPDEPALAENWG